MSDLSPAVDGSSYGQARSFAFAFAAAGGASANKTIAAGSYYLVAVGADCLAVVGLTSGPPVAAALPASQPAAGSPNKHLYCPAGVPMPLDVDADSCSIAALGASTGTGTLNVIGPVGRTIHG